VSERRVAVLGSARLGPDDPAWSVADELGRRLAEAGFTVVSGGYGGLMAAVARAAREAGGHVVGLPMTAWEHLEPNEWNVELVWSDGYPERLGELLASEAIVALDGGVGTLSELAVAWSAAQTEPGAPLLVAIGERWARLLAALVDDLVVSAEDIGLVHVVPSAEAAVALIARPPDRPDARARG
jgi:uncharacterized protein (TIGR00730 family)